MFISPASLTVRSVLQQIARGARSQRVRAYQIYLTTKKRLSPASILIAISALRFLYKNSLRREWAFDKVLPMPKKPRKRPVILSREEVVQFLECVRLRRARVILTTMPQCCASPKP